MKAYIFWDEEEKVFEVSIEDPMEWAGADKDSSIEIDLPLETVQKHLAAQIKWDKRQAGLEKVFTDALNREA